MSLYQFLTDRHRHTLKPVRILFTEGGDDMAEENELILAEIERVKAMIYKNEQLYDLAEEAADVEALIYEYRALSVRLSALIEKAKTMKIRGDSLCGKRR